MWLFLVTYFLLSDYIVLITCNLLLPDPEWDGGRRLRRNVGADYTQNSWHHNNVMFWELDVNMYVTLWSSPLTEVT